MIGRCSNFIKFNKNCTSSSPASKQSIYKLCPQGVSIPTEKFSGINKNLRNVRSSLPRPQISVVISLCGVAGVSRGNPMTVNPGNSKLHFSEIRHMMRLPHCLNQFPIQITRIHDCVLYLAITCIYFISL